VSWSPAPGPGAAFLPGHVTVRPPALLGGPAAGPGGGTAIQLTRKTPSRRRKSESDTAILTIIRYVLDDFKFKLRRSPAWMIMIQVASVPQC
jgi:hypothetical protein